MVAANTRDFAHWEAAGKQAGCKPFGDGGQVRAARRSDHVVVPMPSEREIAEVGQRYSRAQMSRIRFGFMPPDVDYKWFMYYENATLFLHRSWTGFCVFEVQVDELPDGSSEIRKLIVNREKEQNTLCAAKECWKTVRQLINCHLIRGVFSG